MIKRIVLTLTCIALFTALSTRATATPISFQLTPTDSIFFEFIAAQNSTLTATPAGVSTGAFGLKAGTLTASDDNTMITVPMSVVTSSVAISTGAASSYSVSGGVLTADYVGGPAIQVELISPSCGGAGNICVEGVENADQFSETNKHTGSFQGLFDPTYISPTVLAWFGDSGNVIVSGSDTITTGGAKVNAMSATGTIGTGDIEVDIANVSTPEPSSLFLLGSGLLGFAGMLKQRRKA